MTEAWGYPHLLLVHSCVRDDERIRVTNRSERKISGGIGRGPDTFVFARDPDGFGIPRLDSGYKHDRHERAISFQVGLVKLERDRLESQLLRGDRDGKNYVYLFEIEMIEHAD